MNEGEDLPYHQSRVADLLGGVYNINSKASSTSLSEKLPGSHGLSDGKNHEKEKRNEIQKFGEELKAGVSTLSGFWREFKDYIESGDIIDNSLSMAAGQSFTDLMNSFVVDLVVPIFATLLGRPNATNFFLILKSGKDVNAKYKNVKEAKQDGASVLPYGKFLQKSINFVFLGFTLVLFVRMTRTILFFRQRSLKEKKEREKKLQEKDCEFCITKISVKATRCPNCTSILNAEADSATDMEPFTSIIKESQEN